MTAVRLIIQIHFIILITFFTTNICLHSCNLQDTHFEWRPCIGSSSAKSFTQLYYNGSPLTCTLFDANKNDDLLLVHNGHFSVFRSNDEIASIFLKDHNIHNIQLTDDSKYVFATNGMNISVIELASGDSKFFDTTKYIGEEFDIDAVKNYVNSNSIQLDPLIDNTCLVQTLSIGLLLIDTSAQVLWHYSQSNLRSEIPWELYIPIVSSAQQVAIVSSSEGVHKLCTAKITFLQNGTVFKTIDIGESDSEPIAISDYSENQYVLFDKQVFKLHNYDIIPFAITDDYVAFAYGSRSHIYLVTYSGNLLRLDSDGKKALMHLESNNIGVGNIVSATDSKIIMIKHQIAHIYDISNSSVEEVSLPTMQPVTDCHLYGNDELVFIDRSGNVFKCDLSE